MEQVEGHDEDRVALADFGRIIWRRKWMIGLCMVLTTAVVAIGSLNMEPIYEASSTLHIKEQKPSVLGEGIFGGGLSALSTSEEINTQVEILKSRSVLGEVIQELDLVSRYEIESSLGEEREIQSALARLRKGISLSNIPNTQLIRLSVRSEDPELARDVVNAIFEAFIQRNVESKRREANAVLAFVSGQLEQNMGKLKKAEEDLVAYKKAEGIRVFDEEARRKVERLAQLESSHQEARVDREILSTRLAVVQSQLGHGRSDRVPANLLSENPAVKRLRSRLAELQMKMARFEDASSSDTPEAVQTAAEIDSLKGEIRAEIEKTIRSSYSSSAMPALQMQVVEYAAEDIVLATREDALRNFIKIHEAEIDRLPFQEINLLRLERNRRVSDDLYSALMRAKNEAEIEAVSQIGNLEVIDPAVTAAGPVKPTKKKNIMMGLAASLILGIGLAFLFEYLDDTVKTEEDVRKLLGLQMLGLIPRFEAGSGNGQGVVGAGRNGSGSDKKGEAVERVRLITRDDPRSRASEAFRSLRTNLQFVDPGRELKALVVTSPIPGDGKTTIAANLSIMLAAQGKRVLVTDADLRGPMLHTLFDLPDSPGLTNILSEGWNYRNIVHPAEGIANLDVLTSGPMPPNPSELLGSSKMKSLIDEMRGDYDQIIFDAPPVVTVTDAVVLASCTDGALLVLRAGEDDKRVARRASGIFSGARIRVLGGVLNGVNVKDRAYACGKYYHYFDSPGKIRSPMFKIR